MTGSSPSRLRNMASVGPATPQPMMMTLVMCGFEAVLSHASAHRSGFRRGQRRAISARESFFGRRQGEGSKDGEIRTGSSIKGVSSLDPDIVGSSCFEALRCNDGMETRLKSGPQAVSAESPLSYFRLDCPETPLSSTRQEQKFRRFSTGARTHLVPRCCYTMNCQSYVRKEFTGHLTACSPAKIRVCSSHHLPASRCHPLPLLSLDYDRRHH